PSGRHPGPRHRAFLARPGFGGTRRAGGWPRGSSRIPFADVRFDPLPVVRPGEREAVLLLGPYPRRRPLGRHREGAARHPGRRPGRRVNAQSAVVPAWDSVTGSTGPLFSSSASESGSSNGSFAGSIFRTNSSISLPGLKVTTFLEGT